MKALMVMALIATTSFAAGAFASELDNESAIKNITERAKNLPATLIIRVNEKTGEAEIAHLNKDQKEEDAVFTKFETEKAYTAKNLNELDQDQSRESWYLYVGYGYGYGYGYGAGYGYGYGYGYTPAYYYSGYYYPYTPYYGYAYGGYGYSYYRPYYRGYGYGYPGRY